MKRTNRFLTKINRRLKKSLPYTAIIVVILLILIFCSPYLFTQFNFVNWDLEETNKIGGTLGGIMGPFIAIIAAYLTFIAFWVQYKANKKQRKDIRLERFENKFYELLRLHKENVNEVRKINKDGVVKEGRQLFNTMYREFELCHKLILAINKNENGDSNGRDKYFIEMAYNLFYFGVGQGAMNILTEKYYNDLVAKDVIERLQECQENYHNNKTLHNAKLEIPIPDDAPLILHTDVPPFHGYIIGHYYRHLYQTVKYVEAQTFLDEKQKYSYVKTLRAQLTDYEQVMLYYNVISGFGNEWISIKNKEEYSMLIRYKLIHNAPLRLLDLAHDLSPHKHEQLSKEIENWKRNNNGDPFFDYE